MQEPVVIDVGGSYRMWYSAGWGSTQAIGTATSSDGITWTKYASNPIIGQGAGGISGQCGRHAVIKVSTTYHMYLNEFAGTIKHATSSDGISFGTPTTVFSMPSWGTVNNQFGNVSVVIDSGTWYMMYEALTAASSWAIGFATSPDGVTWTDQTPSGPLTTLSIGGAFGGPDLHKTMTGWELWYHAASSSNIPTDIYHSTSTNLTTWTTPVIHIGRSLPWEFDQAADPAWTLQGATEVIYYSGVNNPTEHSKLSRATR